VQVVEDYTDYLVEGIQNLVFIFNPDYIVIGGEISNYSSIFSDKLKAKTFNKNEFYNKENVNILFSLLGNDSNILGAALIPIIDTFGV